MAQKGVILVDTCSSEPLSGFSIKYNRCNVSTSFGTSQTDTEGGTLCTASAASPSRTLVATSPSPRESPTSGSATRSGPGITVDVRYATERSNRSALEFFSHTARKTPVVLLKKRIGSTVRSNNKGTRRGWSGRLQAGGRPLWNPYERNWIL